MTRTAQDESKCTDGGSRIGEVVGGTAAVCCCFPCAVMHLLILAVYKLPTGLWRRKKNKTKRLQNQRLIIRKKNTSSYPQPKMNTGPRPTNTGTMFDTTDDDDDDTFFDFVESDDVTKSGVGLEMEMGDHFYRGFWRSPSQNED